MKPVFAWTFPGGKLKTVTIAATAGDVVTNKSPGAGKRWIILYGRIILVTDATVANRQIGPQLTDGTNILTSYLRTKPLTASTTWNVSLNDVPHVASSSGLGDSMQDQAHLHLPKDIIEGSDQFRITVALGVAGDSYSGYIRVLEIDTP